MALTMNERKEKYHKLVLKKANKIYSSWQTKRITSKQLVAKANEYAFDARLKVSMEYRFHTLAFTVALEKRLKKRYGTFFRRLFRLFAYLRERSALKLLKRVFGFYDFTEIPNMIEVEVENIVRILSQRQDQDSSGGGKHSEMGELEVEEELDAFFKECDQEEKSLLENDLSADNLEKTDEYGEESPIKAEEEQRERISVEELEKDERIAEKKEKPNDSTKEKQTEKVSKETDTVENEKKVGIEEKSVATTSILAEAAAMEQGQEEKDSPFPVFRETQQEGKPTVKETAVIDKEQLETVLNGESGKTFDGATHKEVDESKDLFPVFHAEGVETVKTPEKTVETEVKEVKEITDRKEVENFKGLVEEAKEKHYPQPDISEENKVRRKLVEMMSKEEFDVIVSQIKQAAKIEMERETLAYLERQSLESGSKEIKAVSKEVAPTADKQAIALKPRK